MRSDIRTTCLDSIIFGLQRNGGIANYWARLLEGVSASGLENWRTVIPRSVRFQGYQAAWRFGASHVEALPASLSRYLACHIEPTDSVMHTSYYRLPADPVKKYVVTAYDFMYERYRSGPARWVHSGQKRRSIERADVVSCISAFTRDDVLQYCPGVDPHKLKVIPLGVDTDAFFPDRQAADSKIERTVLFIGRRAGYKRFELALDAVRAVQGLRLGIVGDPMTPNEVASLSTRLPGRWLYFGSVSSRRLRELYSSVFALIFPSDCEGFGLPVLEAMACGCPVVASNRSSLPEVGGPAALLVPNQHQDDYAEALQRLESVERRAAAVAAGMSRVREFSWAKTVQMTLDLYT